MAPYADYHFQYDSNQRVSQEVVAGAGSSTDTGGLGTYSYSYTSSSNIPEFNNWSTKTVVTAPDGGMYTNLFDEVLLDDHHDPVSGLDTIAAYRYNENGQLILAGNRSRVEGIKRIVLEKHGEQQEGQHSAGNDKKANQKGISLLVSAFHAANISANSTQAVGQLRLLMTLLTVALIMIPGLRHPSEIPG